MAKKQIGEIDYNVEFNDSVLSTATWNNPRYNGSKTKTQELNKFTSGDLTYGKKTAVQKYTRNIYVGDYIAACSGSDDPNLVPFPDFSYLMSSKYITVNEDDTIEEKRFRAGVPDEKAGFYRSFLEDFSAGFKCQVYLLNDGVINSLEDSYEIFFNEGRLKKISLYEANDYTPPGDARYVAGNLTVGGLLFPIPSLFGTLTDISGSFTIYDNSELRSTYTGSNVGVTLTGAVVDEVREVFRSIDSKLSSINRDRYFITLITGSNGIIPQINNNVGLFNQKIQTVEVFDYQVVGFDVFGVSKKYNYPLNIDECNYFISKLNTSIPSVLVNLPKDEHLPTGLTPGDFIGGNFHPDPGALQGPKFVIIPENIHPYIKDNIKYFLAQAGLINTNESITINSQNRQLF